ncbi:ribonuclease H-like protein [Obba rivulosa]|uniref:ribonuclease H n=1 Tax=Obba rivulosa TaxID=1052685 RepID=A0A8E2DPV9_9APHY|nr:ribonuclease H-like protein [Obba rivulosa]
MSSHQSHAEGDGAQGVFNRRFLFCDNLQNWAENAGDLILACPQCWRFSARCCQHLSTEEERSCHQYQLAFTDGACLSNGQTGATAGIGVAIGAQEGGFHQLSIPIDDSIDAYPKRSSQRAELLAAIHGLRALGAAKKNTDAEEPQERKLPRTYRSRPLDRSCWVITTDSEYVVKGMTEWFPQWKANGWRGAQGRRPSNLDLFQQLDKEIDIQERRHKVNIGFWHVPREFNGLADSLAKRAARIAPAAMLVG